MAIRRPPTPSGPTTPLPAPIPTPPTASNFNACVALVLISERGNDDDPNDPGGRTSRGITQKEWNGWRTFHPSLPSDVWQAPQDQIIAIYKTNYWDFFQSGVMPAGVDYTVFDTRIMSGAGIRILQSVLDVDQDGEVGPDTLGAINNTDPKTLVNQYQDARLEYLKTLSGWSNYGHGWSARVARVRQDALGMVAKGKADPSTPAPPKPPGNPPPPPTVKTHPFDRLFGGDWQAGLNQMFGGKKT